MAAKEQLKISRWAGNAVDSSVPPFEALINPSGYTLSRTVSILPIGKTRGAERRTLALEKLVLDGTGVVPTATGITRSVEDQVASLLKVTSARIAQQNVVYPVVEVVWASLGYVGRVTGVDTEYTLFAPNGKPLRARVSLKLVEYDEEELQQAIKAATDAMVKQLQADAAARLEELCFKAYHDTGQAQGVARYNGLTSIRNLAPGTVLAFPPPAQLDRGGRD